MSIFMAKEYSLMKESMLILKTSQLYESDFELGKKRVLEAETEKMSLYSQKKLKVEITCVSLSFNKALFRCEMKERLITLWDDAPSYIEYTEFSFKVITKGKKDFFFINHIEEDGLERQILSKKIYMGPFENSFLPKEFYSMTTLAKRKLYSARGLYPYQDELAFSHLYWKKRMKEQQKLYLSLSAKN